MQMQTRMLHMEDLSQIIDLQLSNGGRAPLIVTGCSMEPMLRHRRDSVVLIPVTGQCKKGDVIFYRRENGQYVLHRIVARNGCDYVCCGDNQAMREPVSHSQLIAVVEGFTRKGKRYDITSPGYRLYVFVWVELFFLRGVYIFIRRKIGSLYRRLRKWWRHRNSRRNGGNHG